MPSIRELHFPRNHLEVIPDEISKLTQLRTLDVSGNKLKALPKSFSEIASLKFLNLNFNFFVEVPAFLKSMKLSLSFSAMTQNVHL